MVYATLLFTFVSSDPSGSTTTSGGSKAKPSFGEIMRVVLESSVVARLAICYLGIGIVRDFFSNWSPEFIQGAYKGSGLADDEIESIIKATSAAKEFGGIVGTILAGVLTDSIFGGRRTPVIALLTMAICPILLFTVYMPVSIVREMPNLIFFALGCCFTSPHVLIGLAARELVPPHISSSAGGFVSAISKVGSMVAGYPIGKVTDVYGSDGALKFMAITTLAGGLATLSLWNARPHGAGDKQE